MTRPIQFQQLFADVTPLKSNGRVHHRATPTPLKPHHPTLSETPDKKPNRPRLASASFSHPIQPITPEKRLNYAGNGIQHRVIKRLQRGGYPIARTLDLHGYCISEAEKLTEQFLCCGFRDPQQCLRIIHGKGLSRQCDYAVLKSHLNSWLRYHPLVLAFCSALPHDGGSGALYVLIRR